MVFRASYGHAIISKPGHRARICSVQPGCHDSFSVVLLSPSVLTRQIVAFRQSLFDQDDIFSNRDTFPFIWDGGKDPKIIDLTWKIWVQTPSKDAQLIHVSKRGPRQPLQLLIFVRFCIIAAYIPKRSAFAVMRWPVVLGVAYLTTALIYWLHPNFNTKQGEIYGSSTTTF